jgi:hypothetical protein
MRIRAASKAQGRAIAAFCLREDPDDYVPQWMDRLLRQGRFYVLTDGRRIAGLVHGQLAPDGSAWLSAARIHHDYRGHGWINRLNDFALARAPLDRAPAARMLISASNESSIRAAKKGGFRVAARLCLVEWEAPKGERHPRIEPGMGRIGPERFVRACATSRVLAAQDGLVYMPFTGAFSPTLNAVRGKSGWLYGGNRSSPLMAAFFSDTGEKWLGCQAFGASRSFAARLVAFAAGLGAKSMTLALPDHQRFRRPFLEAGFGPSDWARHVRIFERRIERRGGPPTPSRARPPAAR